jgi:exodeoxyribonuclease VII large subunit
MADYKYTVSQINLEIKDIVERSIPTISVTGEISNFKPHYSGHAYLTLKDDSSQLSVVMWKSNVEKLKTDLEDGMEVNCTGRISVYERAGRYQLIANNIEELGKGDLQKKFEDLKQSLYEKGYFDELRKQSIPKYPQEIGVITSPTGAALQDILSIASRRNPNIQIILRGCQVQGKAAAPDIVKAIQEFNRQVKKVDLIILGRGGGSLEDLWAFNEETVAEAIYNSKIPIISAVGHEIDFSISDFVADFRAATPSAAAEIAFPKRDDMLSHLAYLNERSQTLLEQKLNLMKEKVERLKSHYAIKKVDFIITEKKQILLDYNNKLHFLYKRKLEQKRATLENLKSSLLALNPNAVLDRGYAIVRQKEKLIDSYKKLKSGYISIQFKDGIVDKKLVD